MASFHRIIRKQLVVLGCFLPLIFSCTERRGEKATFLKTSDRKGDRVCTVVNSGDRLFFQHFQDRHLYPPGCVVYELNPQDLSFSPLKDVYGRLLGGRNNHLLLDFPYRRNHHEFLSYNPVTRETTTLIARKGANVDLAVVLDDDRILCLASGEGFLIIRAIDGERLLSLNDFMAARNESIQGLPGVPAFCEPYLVIGASCLYVIDLSQGTVVRHSGAAYSFDGENFKMVTDGAPPVCRVEGGVNAVIPHFNTVFCDGSSVWVAPYVATLFKEGNFFSLGIGKLDLKTSAWTAFDGKDIGLGDGRRLVCQAISSVGNELWFGYSFAPGELGDYLADGGGVIIYDRQGGTWKRVLRRYNVYSIAQTDQYVWLGVDNGIVRVQKGTHAWDM